MTNTYTFCANDQFVTRSSDNAFIPWDKTNNRPFDIGGLVGQIWIDDGSPTPAEYVAPPPPIPQTITERQFFMQLATEGDITWDECITFLSNGTLPTVFANAIAQIPTTQDVNAQNKAKAAFIGAKEFDRQNPLTVQIGQLMGKTDAQMDAIWVAANQIV